MIPPYDAVEQLANSRFPDDYSGLAIARSGGIEIYRTPPAVAFDAAIRALHLNIHLRFCDARRSLRELDTVQQRVWHDCEFWQKRGVVLATTCINVRANKIEVGLAVPPTAEQDVASALQTYYLFDAIQVSATGPVQPARNTP